MYIVTINNGGALTEIHGEVNKVSSGKVVKGINTIDSFSFALLPNNPGFNQLRYYVDETLAKSETWMTKITKAMEGDLVSPPAPGQSWADQVLQAGAAAVEAAERAESAAVRQPIVGDNGNWWTWDPDAGAYGDTGIYSGGDAPYIGANGNWYVGQTDTGVAAAGPQGPEGDSFEPQELFYKEFLKDPGNRNTFVTIDGVPYYRYHADGNSFYYDIPNPRAGAVTITMRVANQYSTSVDSRIYAVFSDGTETVIGWSAGETFTYTTDAAKTLVRIRGNWDAESWMLIDLSVMSIRASWIAWEIPAAAESAMGGVYADQAEASDIQPVRIGADGKLYTAPGGTVSDEKLSQAVENYLTENPPEADLSGYVKAPAAAEVGQTIRVSAVDENGQPTEWEAVDMINGASEWELINEATLTEDEISEITISEDSNGNPFELSAVYVLIFGKGSVNSGIKIEIQSTTNEAYKNKFHNFGLLGSCLSTDGKWSAAYIEHICNREWNTAFKGSAQGSAAPAATQNYDAFIESSYATWQAKPDGNIRAVQLTTFSGTFSSGAKLILYGKRV